MLTFSLAVAAVSLAITPAPGDVLTHHNGNTRAGLNDAETVLTPANVNVDTFGKLFTQPVDGEIYAQPLVLSGVAIPGKGTHKVVFIATEHNSVYAFDADDAVDGNAEPLWKRSFIDPARGITSVPYLDVGTTDINPEIGITGTPVIDAASGTLYCVARTKENGAFYQRLHALDVRTGAERPGSPKLIKATVNGIGDGPEAGGKVRFDPQFQNQRAGLLLLNGVVYIAWAAHGVNGPYHGWILGYHAKTLAQVAVFCSTPNAGRGGIWQGGGGLAADDLGNIFVSTGNGDFGIDENGQHVGTDYGDSVLRLATTSTGALSVADFFAPMNQAVRNEQDRDLGSSGVILLPPIPGSERSLAVVSGKAVKDEFGIAHASIYLLDRTNLGGFDATEDHVVQRLDDQIKGGFGMPAIFRETIYFHGSDYGGNDVLKAFDFSTGLLSTTPTATANLLRPFAFPGSTPSISANGRNDGIVWEIERRQPAFLHAYDAADISKELYNSSLLLHEEDSPGNAIKFSTPTIAHGKVYIGCVNRFTVFGLRNDAKPPLVKVTTPAEGARLTTPNVTLTGTVSDPTGVQKLEFRVENFRRPGDVSGRAARPRARRGPLDLGCRS